MKVLVACEESQAVTIEFRKLGHEAYSCDIQECSGGHPEWHIQDDVLDILNPIRHFKASSTGGKWWIGISFTTNDAKFHTVKGKWDIIIAHPPCTYLSNAGARWLYPNHILNEERYKKGLEAKEFFMQIWNANCEKICIENPMPSKIFNLPPPTQIIQPYQFDIDKKHPWTKKTLLWIKGMNSLIPTTPDAIPAGPYCPAGTSRKDRSKYGAAKRGEDAKNRAKTFSGIAKAMAEQWGKE